VTRSDSDLTRILVVDDDEVDREAVRRLLARTELSVAITEAVEPLSALSIARKMAFDLILLDYNFPRHDGMFLLRELREAGLTVPVIMLTAQEDTALAVELMKSGATDFVSKSGLTAQRLALAVRHALRIRASELAAHAIQEALRASEELNRRILEGSHDRIEVLDLDGHVLAMSRIGREALEIADLSLVHRRGWLDLWPAGEHRTAASAALATATLGKAGRFVGLGPSLSGRAVWWSVVVCPVMGADGKAERLLAISRELPAP
jgi:phosphoserine phosphatase RsbU/P